MTSPSLSPTLGGPGSGTHFTLAPADPSCSGAQSSNCSLTTPVVQTVATGHDVLVSWSTVEGAVHYTVNCEAVGAGTGCVTGGGDVKAPTTSTHITVGADGIYHFSVKAHGSVGEHKSAKGQNSLTGWASNNNDIDICVGSCTPTIAPEKEHVHVDVSCPASVTYNGAAQEPCSASVTGDKGLSATLSVTYANNVNAGTASASASYVGDATHDGGTGSETFTINKAPILATAGSASTVYNGQSVTASDCTLAGALFGDLTCANDTPGGPDAGTTTTNAIVSGDSTNFTISYVTGSIVIAKAPVTLTAGSGGGVYSGLSQSAAACSVSGAYTGDIVCSNDVSSAGPGIGSTTTTAVILGTKLDNFIVTYVAGSIVISPAPMTATAFSGGRTFGQANPTDCMVSGAVNGEVYSCTTSSTANAGSGVGTSYPTVATMVANPGLSNYSITYVGGLLNVLAYDLSNCYIAPIYSSLAATGKSQQKKGSTLPIKCIIKSTTGYVSNGSGSLVIRDVTAPSTASITGGFTLTSGTPPLYMNQQDTSNKFYVSGHTYTVDTQWNDGSTTHGYFSVAK